jgi:hypothetical protein
VPHGDEYGGDVSSRLRQLNRFVDEGLQARACSPFAPHLPPSSSLSASLDCRRANGACRAPTSRYLQTRPRPREKVAIGAKMAVNLPAIAHVAAFAVDLWGPVSVAQNAVRQFAIGLSITTLELGEDLL